MEEEEKPKEEKEVEKEDDKEVDKEKKEEEKRIKKEKEEEERKKKEEEERIKKEEEERIQREKEEAEKNIIEIKEDNKEENKDDTIIDIKKQNIESITDNITRQIIMEKEEMEKKLKKEISIFKTLRLFCFIAKPLGSFLWSYANSLYHFEKIELNKVYSCRYILCVGYRWQPKQMLNFMKKFMPNLMKKIMPNLMEEKGFFFDININPISVIHSIICTYIKYEINRHEQRKVCAWKWILASSIFYTLPNSLNFNLNIKFKDIYLAINISGLIAELLDMMFLQRTRGGDSVYKELVENENAKFILNKKKDSSNNNNKDELNNNTNYGNSSMNTIKSNYINQQTKEKYTPEVKTSNKINNIKESQYINSNSFQNININNSQNLINNNEDDIISTKIISTKDKNIISTKSE